MLYRLEKLVNGDWRMEGTYSERYVPQLANAVCVLTTQGFVMNETMRVTVMKSGKDTA